MISFERHLREIYPPELPYGFAERVASAIMTPAQNPFWDFLLAFSPRAGIAVGAFATILMILSFIGGAPGLFDSIEHYSTLSGILPIP